MVRIIALTEQGLALAERLALSLNNASVWFKPRPFAQKVQEAFLAKDRLIFICATGIVVRTLAPVLQNKFQDPPVLVMDEIGAFVIPLLSGHEGGANDWAKEISQLLAATCVITTAKSYLNPVYAVGMGCERNCPLDYLEELLLDCLSKTHLTLDQVDSIHSISIKSDEVNLIRLCEKLKKTFVTWDAETLSVMEPLLDSRSDYVYQVTGVYGVAESAALYGVQQIHGTTPELLLKKQKNPKATCAIARSFSDT